MASAYVFALLPAALAGLSAYTLYHSYNSIQNVRAYEDPAERAAKYSNIAEDQLSQTRTTEGAGAVATVVSLISSLTLATIPIFSSTAHSASPSPSRVTFLVPGVVNAAACFGAQRHIAGYWKSKAKVPFVKKYNNAISGTNLVRVFLGYLGWGWVVLGGAGAMFGS